MQMVYLVPSLIETKEGELIAILIIRAAHDGESRHLTDPKTQTCCPKKRADSISVIKSRPGSSDGQKPPVSLGE